MSGFGNVWLTVLDGAIVAGRSALRDLDAKEIPASLNRVAAYQGGRLPPPLATRLLTEIDKNDWLRDKVVDAWDGESGEPSDLFLNRPAEWWIDLNEFADAAGASQHNRQLDDLQARLQQVEAKKEKATRKATDLQKAAQEAERRRKELVDAARRAAEERYTAEIAEMDELQSDLAAAKEALSELKVEHRELQDAFDVVRSRLAKVRRHRFDDDADQPGGSSSLPRDPVKLARLLDLQSAEMGRDVGSVQVTPSAESTLLVIAPGVRPDSSDAIRWLLALDQAVVVLVDGYNAQFHIDGSDFTSGGARRRLVEALKRVRTASTVKHRIVVIYDSTLPGSRAGRTSLGGVEVRFAEKDRIADEEIVDMTKTLDHVVVISSDRAVRDGAEANGAVVLWSEALEQWLARQ